MPFAEFLVKGTLMPLVIACPRCRRRYDVGKRPVGSRFRCQCGSVLTNRRPVGLASTVMCPCCGAPQHDGETACSHCGSTLLDWVRSGGMAKVKQQETDEAARAEQRKSSDRLAGVRGMLGRNPHENEESYVRGGYSSFSHFALDFALNIASQFFFP